MDSAIGAACAGFKHRAALQPKAFTHNCPGCVVATTDGDATLRGSNS
jgi:hypothetical protein